MSIELPTELPDDIQRIIQDVNMASIAEFTQAAMRPIEEFDVIKDLIDATSNSLGNTIDISNNPPIVQLRLPLEDLRFDECEIQLELYIEISKIANVYSHTLNFEVMFPLPDNYMVSLSGNEAFFGSSHYNLQRTIRNIFQSHSYREMLPHELEYVLCDYHFILPQLAGLGPQPRVEMLLFNDFFDRLQ